MSYDDMLDSRMHDLFDPDPIFSPCGDHRGLWSMPFARALEVARACDQCYVEEVDS